MDWSLLRTIIVGVLSVTTIIATAGVGLMFGSLRTLRDTSNDLRARVSDLEKERAEDKAENAELAGENKLLKSMMTGKVEWVALTDQLEHHHKQALVWWEKADGRLVAIQTAVEARP